jgi:hypothetical protein
VANLFWRSGRPEFAEVSERAESGGAAAEPAFAERHWPPSNTFEQSMFVSIAAMLADDVLDAPDPIAAANERFALVLHIHVSAMRDDDLSDWCAADVGRIMAAGDPSARVDHERLFIAWCEGLFTEILDSVIGA